jgi:hypothetical protein
MAIAEGKRHDVADRNGHHLIAAFEFVMPELSTPVDTPALDAAVRENGAGVVRPCSNPPHVAEFLYVIKGKDGTQRRSSTELAKRVSPPAPHPSVGQERTVVVVAYSQPDGVVHLGDGFGEKVDLWLVSEIAALVVAPAGDAAITPQHTAMTASSVHLDGVLDPQHLVELHAAAEVLQPAVDLPGLQQCAAQVRTDAELKNVTADALQAGDAFGTGSLAERHWLVWRRVGLRVEGRIQLRPFAVAHGGIAWVFDR